MSELDLSKYSVRTDLAVEAKEMLEEREQTKEEITGIIVKDREVDGVTISHVHINETATERIGKKAGNYLTLQVQGIREQDTELQDRVEKVFANEFNAFLKNLGITEDQTCLVVGLGNWNVTPDALGPMVVENLVVTKHLFELQPESVQEGYRPVCALAPGVMGITGIETSDIISGVIEKVKPDFVIAIDALAARSIERVNTTIQITDNGIHPGSGIGNKRKELSKETLGIPVIAIGVPTVVDAVAITSDTIDYILKVAAVLQKNLEVIDHAIGESRAALQTQPTSEVAQESLFEALRNKVSLLQDTVSLINEMRKGNPEGTARAVSGLNQ